MYNLLVCCVLIETHAIDRAPITAMPNIVQRGRKRMVSVLENKDNVHALLPVASTSLEF
jgi:hypothetical protein